MMAVPNVLPRTTPEPVTEATVGVPLLQLPPEGVSVSVLVVPGHNVTVPPMAAGAGKGLTVIGKVARPVPQLLVTR